MSTPSPRLPAVLAGTLLCSCLGTAQAAPCGRPDIDATFPPNGSRGVPPNSLFSAHYGSPAVYANEAVTVTDSTGKTVSVTVVYDDADSMLRAAPEQSLSEGRHEIAWPGLRGVNGAAGRGRDRATTFTVQSALDTAPPAFTGLSAVTWDLSRDRDPCLDRLDDRFVFELQVGTAADDSGAELLSLLAFQTLDPLLPERAQPRTLGVYPWPSDGVLEIRRPSTQAGKTCFAAVAQDLTAHLSGGGEREVCVTTKRPPFFEGCAVTTPVPGAATYNWHAGFLLVGVALLRRGKALNARATGGA